MKAKNYKEVTRGYLIFTFGMVVLVGFFIITALAFISTNRIEHAKMMTQTIVFDQIHSKQINIVERVDSLYNYMSLINSSDRVNNAALESAVSNRKMQLLDYTSSMSDDDVLLYNRLMEQINTFLDIKDNISSLTSQEQLLKHDLQRCINDNKQTSRQLNIWGAKQ